MGEWLRDTPWRQGRILSAESAKQLGLAYPDPSQEPVVVVISHDCDLAQPIDKEPNCEAIVGRTVDKLDGNFAWAKTARRLHLPFSDGPTKIIGEFSALDKIVISKAALADHLPAT